MRKFVKNSILEIFQTMYEAHVSIKKMIDKKDFENVSVLLEDCQNTAVQIGTSIESSEGEGFVTVGYLEEYCEAVYEVATSISDDYSGNKAQKVLDKKLIKAENSVKNDVKVRLEIVFCPYKASMWDSLESVWKAADEDPDCDAYVVPIPYYDRNPDYSFGEFHYEGGDYPDYVPITHYEAYNFEARRPDAIYIHNPYDDCNYVTSVDPRFYSRELKKYTDCLVFVPYFISGYFSNPENYDVARTPGVYFSHKVVLQSETLKRVYIMNGVNQDKIIVSGSPKIDAVIDNDITNFPSFWRVLKDRKICLINSSITCFLSWQNFLQNLKMLIDELVNQHSYAVIWRPHPLLESTINSMRTESRHEFIDFLKWFSEQNYCIRDITPDPRYAIIFSDILLSDYSSLIFSYVATGKPIVEIINEAAPENNNAFNVFSTNSLYKYNYSREPIFDLPERIEGILETDYMKSERMKSFKNSIVNSDGTCGLKTHNKLKDVIF